MKAILIARVSTEEQKEAGNSLPAQVARLERYCQNKDYAILRICSFDESAYCEQRTEFDHIIDFILEQNEKVIVCCDKVDRLSRNIFDKRISMLYERALKDEIELHFVSDGQVINSNISAVEKFQFGISLGLAKYYSDAVSDNIKRAIEQKVRKGEWPGRPPYGYKNVALPGGKKDIIVDDCAARVVRKAFELYATEAYSMQLLCEKLKTENDVHWARGYLDFILKNPFYYGQMLHKNKLYAHRYPPLISQMLFEKVQTVKANFNKKEFKYAGQPYIYRGLIRCADCGMSITPEKHKGHVYYHCTQYKGEHDAQWLREEEITRQLGNVFNRLKVPEDLAVDIAKTLRELHASKIEFHDKQFAELNREHKKLTKMLDALYMDKLEGSITGNEYERHYHTLRAKLTEIGVKLEQLQEADDNYFITSKYVLDLSSRAFELFKSSEVDEKRQLIKLVLSNLELKDEKLVWQAQKPFDLIMEMNDCQAWCARRDSNPRPTD